MRGLTLQRIAEVTEGTLHLSILTADGIFGTVDEDGLERAQHATRGAFAKISQEEVSSITTDSRKAGEGEAVRMAQARHLPAVILGEEFT